MAGKADHGSPAAGEPALLREALRLHRAGRLREAAALYRQALQRQPRHAAALHLLGLVAQQSGDNGGALKLIDQAIASEPGIAEFHNSRGLLLQLLGRLEESLASLRRAIALDAAYAEAHGNLAGSLHRLGRLDEAVASYERALALRPDGALLHFRLANLQRELGRTEAAQAGYRRALAVKPDFAEAHNNLASAFIAQDRLGDALTHLQRAVAITPAYATAHYNLGVTLQALGRTTEAIASYKQALAQRPDYPEALTNLGNIALAANAPGQAIEFYRQALAIDGGQFKAHYNQGNALQMQGDLPAAVACYRRSLALQKHYPKAYSSLLMGLNYDPSFTAAEIAAEHRRLGAALQAAAGPVVAPDRDHSPDRRLRIGYVSPDFRSHACAFFIEPLLAAHDRARVEIYCYANLAEPDGMTERLRALADHWRPIAGRGDRAVAAEVAADRIDILVDLAGHNSDNRLELFALKPAPVQVSWLGYPNTTGLPAIDYRLSDGVADPPGESDALYTERLVRLPRGFLCYRPPEDAPAVALPRPRPDGGPTFASFNNASKLSAPTLALWAQILAAVPGSRLLLKAHALGDAGARLRVLRSLTGDGVAAERVEMQPFRPTIAESLGCYGEVDIALDPFPYNGTTTSCEALWMGVPVIALAGDRHAGRVGASLLHMTGLEELLAATPQEYVAKAVALAGDRERLVALRADLRARLAGSALCDAAGFAAAVEAAYRAMWQRWCAGR